MRAAGPHEQVCHGRGALLWGAPHPQSAQIQLLCHGRGPLTVLTGRGMWRTPVHITSIISCYIKRSPNEALCDKLALALFQKRVSAGVPGASDFSGPLCQH